MTADSRRSRAALLSIAAGAAVALVVAVAWAVAVEFSGSGLVWAPLVLGLLVGAVMARTTPAWRPLAGIAGLVALCGSMLGEVLADAMTASKVLGIDAMAALREMVRHPHLLVDVFRTGFGPVDALFWLLAAAVAFRLTSNSVWIRRRARATWPAPSVAAAPPERTASRTSRRGQQARPSRRSPTS